MRSLKAVKRPHISNKNDTKLPAKKERFALAVLTMMVKSKGRKDYLPAKPNHRTLSNREFSFHLAKMFWEAWFDSIYHEFWAKAKLLDIQL